jgi:hypothetical protein
MSEQKTVKALPQSEQEALIKEAQAVSAHYNTYLNNMSPRRSSEIAGGIGVFLLGGAATAFLIRSAVKIETVEYLIAKQFLYISGITVSLLFAIAGARVALGTIFDSDSDRYMKAVVCQQLLERWHKNHA